MSKPNDIAGLKCAPEILANAYTRNPTAIAGENAIASRPTECDWASSTIGTVAAITNTKVPMNSAINFLIIVVPSSPLFFLSDL